MGTKINFRIHAVQRMFQWQISEADVKYVLKEGDVIKEYPDDKPFPSRLIFCFVNSRPIHIVAAENKEESETVIVTAYEPDPSLWEEGFRRRKK